MAMPDQWTEIAFVAISDEDGNEYSFGTITDTIDLSWGSRDVESIATVSAGRVTKFTPEDITEITLELFPVGISSSGSTPNGIQGWFMGIEPTATEGKCTFTRKKFRVTVLWTTAAAGDFTSATGAIPTTGTCSSLRFSFWNAYLTDSSVDFTDDIVKSTVTFKCAPYDRAGESLIIAEEKDAGQLVAIPAYAGAAPTVFPPTWA